MGPTPSSYDALFVFVVLIDMTLGLREIVPVVHVHLIIRLFLNPFGHPNITGDDQHRNGNNQIQDAKDRKQDDQILRFPRGTKGIESLLQKLYPSAGTAAPHGP